MDETTEGICPKCNKFCITVCDNDCGTFYCDKCSGDDPEGLLEFHFGFASMKNVLGHDPNCHGDESDYEDFNEED